MGTYIIDHHDEQLVQEPLGSIILAYHSVKTTEQLLVVAFDVESKLHFNS